MTIDHLVNVLSQYPASMKVHIQIRKLDGDFHNFEIEDIIDAVDTKKEPGKMSIEYVCLRGYAKLNKL